MKEHSILFFLLVLIWAPLAANGQYSGAWGTTWNNPTSSLASVMIQGAINKKMLERSIANQRGKSTGSTPAAGSSTSAAARSQNVTPVDNAVLRFKPVANSRVPKQVAEALSKDPQERAALLKIFLEVKKSYEAEVAKDGKSNSIAAALTFFMASVSMVYHQTDEPPETVTNGLLDVLEQELSPSPDFKKMADLEKQKMHDWLVVSGGFVLAGYLDAVQKSDQQQLADYKELANEFFKIVLGTGAEKFNLAAVGGAPAVENAAPSGGPVAPPASSSSKAGAMPAADLVKEFESNEVRANQSYAGKRVSIYGSVNSIEQAADGRIILTFNRTAMTYSNAQCFLDKSQSSRVAAVNTTDKVTLEGTVKGMGGGAMGIKAFLVLETAWFRSDWGNSGYSPYGSANSCESGTVANGFLFASNPESRFYSASLCVF